VRITARVFAQIVGVERDIPRSAKLVVLHLSRRNQVRISRKSARVVPCQQLRLARHGERERTVGQKQHTFRKRFVQTHRHRIRTVQADFDFVALVEYALVGRVDFRALRLPFDVIVNIRNRQKYHSILLIFYSTIYIITKLYYRIKQKSIEKIAINLDFLEIRVKIFAYFSFFCYNKDIKSKLCNMEEFGMAIINYIEKHLKTFSVTKHMHNDWEIIYVTEGSGTIETENNHIIPYTKGDVICIPPQIRHINHSSTGFKNVHLTIEDFAPPIQAPTHITSCEAGKDLYSLLKLAYRYFHQLEGNHPLNLSLTNAITTLLTHLLAQTEANKITQVIVNQIINNYTDGNFSLEEAYSLIPLSKEYIRKLFIKEYGISPLQYLQQRRIELAKQLLAKKGNDYSRINEIAQSCGFYDSAYFSRLFKKITGYAPSEYKPTLLDNNKIFEKN
jgi:AraC-like DNA-binding protein/mannose-6-phosphate isomerase-like protein (cupin superfamily)